MGHQQSLPETERLRLFCGILVSHEFPKVYQLNSGGGRSSAYGNSIRNNAPEDSWQYLNTVSGRFEFVFTSRHGSWLNMIEGFFSKMTKQMLNGIRVTTRKELEERIYGYFNEINKEPVPYKWTYKMDTIDLSKENIDTIVYEVVNAKAASAENKNKKAPKPISRRKKSAQN